MPRQIKIMNILFSGWTRASGHSYNNVNCFQLLALYENYRDRINFYIDERPYFNVNWPGNLVYGPENNKIIEQFPKHDPNNKINIDLEYRITYPHDICMIHDKCFNR